jgi:hypothetical protein
MELNAVTALPQHVRLIGPQGVFNAIASGRDTVGLDADLAMIIEVCKLVEPPPCLICERKLGECPPSVIGWADTPRGRATFLICQDCGEPGVEEAIFDKLGFKPMEHCGSA